MYSSSRVNQHRFLQDNLRDLEPQVHASPAQVLPRSKTITRKIHALNNLDLPYQDRKSDDYVHEWATAHVENARVARITRRRATRPLACPDPSLQRSNSTTSTDAGHDDEAVLREKMYDHATWRMYYRITNSRQLRDQQHHIPHSAVPAVQSRPVPIRNNNSDGQEQQLDGHFEYFGEHSTNLASSWSNDRPPPTSMNEGLSNSVHSGIFVMDMED